MTHDTPLIAIIAIGLSMAFVLGLVAHRFRLPLIAGYLMAGVIIGPFTPGFVANQDLANELAEIGVILLMFGVGLHFSLKDLLAVKAAAVPGALGQIAVATAAGVGLAWALGWGIGAGVIFGLSLSVASTVVLLRALQSRGILKDETGKLAVGWLIVEDLVMVVVLVLIPPLAGVMGGVTVPVEGEAAAVASWGFGPLGATLLLTGAKVAGFIGLMLIVGARVIPMVLHYSMHTGQRELFRLAVLAIALGVAYGSAVFFGVSFALGAFFAGMVMASSTLSTQAMKDTLPLRDAFAVLFFVSVGMLFNPSVIWTQPLALAGTVVIVLGIKSVAAYVLMRWFGHDRSAGFVLAASLAQVGEFSFILIGMGVSLKIVPVGARDLVVAAALLSILVNPLLFHLADRYAGKPTSEPL
ncbi:cation:proton antiporter [Cypionkella sp. TWP1-2-1b2]|uniref:cation:proton antiporter domain-containing protein n=1 Tax=Cypionkella sp. TWP1-2-1b2 TaxID=2804675 RepID=UPI003CEBAFBB